MMRIELGILGRSKFQVTINTCSYLEDEEIKGYLNHQISSPSLFDFWSTSLERIVVRKENTNNTISGIFLQDLIDDLVRKYDEYFTKIIITCDGAKYHSVELIIQILTREEMMVIVPYT